jgi:hypothetical protein
MEEVGGEGVACKQDKQRSKTIYSENRIGKRKYDGNTKNRIILKRIITQCKDADLGNMAQRVVPWWALVNIWHLSDGRSNH